MQPKIIELRKFILNLDERISRYEKIGRSTDQLKENRAHAQQTLMKLNEAEKGNGMVCRK